MNKKEPRKGIYIVLFCLITGYFAANYLSVSSIYALFLLCGLTIIMYFRILKAKFLILVSLTCSFTVLLHISSPPSNQSLLLPKTYSHVSIKKQHVRKTDKFHKIEGYISHFKTQIGWVQTKDRYKCLIYIPKNIVLPGQNYSIILNEKLDTIQKSIFPHTFDYASYAAEKGIYYVCYPKENSYAFKKETGYSIINEFSNYRKFIEEKFQKTLGTNASALSIAILTGNKDYLTEESKAAFSALGVMHVMAVSGMHVGLIYVILYFFISHLPVFKKNEHAGNILALSLLWVYIGICGFPISGVRAGLMISIFLISRVLQKNIQFFHVLIITCICILIIWPNMWKEVGFQLSIAAMLGIGFIIPQLQKIIDNKNVNFISKYLIGSLFLTISTTAFTLPFVLHYFNQFPIYFLPANLIVVPLATLFLYVNIPILVLPESLILHIGYQKIVEEIGRWLYEIPLYFKNLLGELSAPLYFSEIEIILYLSALFVLISIFQNYRFQKLLLLELFVIASILMSSKNELAIHEIKKSKVEKAIIIHNRIKSMGAGKAIFGLEEYLIKSHNTITELTILDGCKLDIDSGTIYFTNDHCVILNNGKYKLYTSFGDLARESGNFKKEKLNAFVSVYKFRQNP